MHEFHWVRDEMSVYGKSAFVHEIKCVSSQTITLVRRDIDRVTYAYVVSSEDSELITGNWEVSLAPRGHCVLSELSGHLSSFCHIGGSVV